MTPMERALAILCIVARNLPGLVAVRDSKEPDGAKLVVSLETWRASIRSV